jgi:hypothetical protein
MTLLSIDIGIKNLALCILDTPTTKIIYWDVLNICNMNTQVTETKVCCTYCKNNAKYTKLNNNYCIKHSKKQTEYFIPTGDLLQKKLNKNTIDQLKELIEKYKIEVDINNNKKITKKKYLELINNRLLEPITTTTDSDNIENKKVSEYNLIDICRIMTHKLDIELDKYISNITDIVIENQISPIANRMKSIQSMVTQYFVIKCNPNTNIMYVSAMNKLKGIETNSYTERKKASIEKCKDMLTKTTESNTEWLEYFNKHKKKDDLSDCYIQGLWYINKNV